MNSELTGEEIPPQRIWHHDERLAEWFAAVSDARVRRMKGEDTEDVPDADGDDDDTFVDPSVTALRRA